VHDIRATWPQAKAVILRMEWISVTPPTLDVYVKDPIKDVTAIYLDSRKADLYVIMTPTRLRISPDVADFRAITIYVEPYSLNEAGIRVALDGQKYVSGPERLLQMIARMWMTQVGSVMDHEGIGTLVTQQDMNNVGSEGIPYLVTERVQQMKTLILANQASQNIMDSERLVDLQVAVVVALPGTAYVNVYMRITTAAGNLVLTLSTEV